MYNGECRRAVILYKAHCTCCGKFYIGNTQQTMKAQMSKHYSEACTFANTGKQSDTFARHFGQHAREDKDPSRLVTAGDIRKYV